MPVESTQVEIKGCTGNLVTPGGGDHLHDPLQFVVVLQGHDFVLQIFQLRHIIAGQAGHRGGTGTVDVRLRGCRWRKLRRVNHRDSRSVVVVEVGGGCANGVFWWKHFRVVIVVRCR